MFTRCRKLNISIVFITQLYFKVPKDVRLNSTHFFIMKILNKRELQQIALNHSSDYDFKDLIKICTKCTAEPYSFLVNDTTLPSDDVLKFRRNLLKIYILKSWLLKIRLEISLKNKQNNWRPSKKQIGPLEIKEIKEIKPRETKPNEYGDYFINEKAKIRQFYEPVDLNDLAYNFKDSRIPSINFIKFKGPLRTFKGMHGSDISLEDVEK